MAEPLEQLARASLAARARCSTPPVASSWPRKMFSAMVRPSTTSSSWYIVAMPMSMRGDRVRDLDLLALPDDLAAVGLVRAGEDLDERRLAGAVLAEHAVHLARDDVEVDAAKRLHAGERLRDPAHRQ